MRRGAASPEPSSDDAEPSVTGRSDPVVRAQEEPQHPRSSRSPSLRASGLGNWRNLAPASETETTTSV
ncbi:unnamed protein product [Boreogadus saida]